MRLSFVKCNTRCCRTLSFSTLPPPYPQGRFSAIRMMDVDMIERCKLCSDLTAEQGGGERSSPAIVCENDDMIGI